MGLYVHHFAIPLFRWNAIFVLSVHPALSACVNMPQTPYLNTTGLTVFCFSSP